MEIFSKANDLDGGSELQYYHLINHEGEEEENLLYEKDEKNNGWFMISLYVHHT